MNALDRLDRIEALLAEIEAADAATDGAFRQAEDREAFDIAARIERRMRQNQRQPSEAAP